MLLRRSNQEDELRKLYLYSGHDVTLVNVMRALDIIAQTTKKPDYSSALHFELHRNPNMANDFEVKVNKMLFFHRFENLSLTAFFLRLIDILRLQFRK